MATLGKHPLDLYDRESWKNASKLAHTHFSACVHVAQIALSDSLFPCHMKLVPPPTPGGHCCRL